MIIGNPITLGGGNQYVWDKYTTDLPNGYTQVEYIESTGTQYIDTGFNPNSNTRIVIDLEVANTTSYYFYGVKTSNTANTWFGGGYTTQTNLEVWSNTLTNITVDSATKRRTIDHNKNLCSTNDGYSATLTASTFQCSYPMYLFSMDENGSPIAGGTGNGKLYSCQIYDNGVLVRDFVPCKNANGKAGLYDCENGVFYPNAGSGEFGVGNAVDTEVNGEYIGQVKNSNVNAYPFRGAKDGYYYVAVGETINITESGFYDVRVYATANVYDIKPVLLWTNASPSSSFAAQTVSVDSGYDGYIIEGKYSNTADGHLCKSYIPVGSSTHMCGSTSNLPVLSGRVVTATGSSVAFSTGYYNAQPNTSYCIPTRIWGVKFTL